MKRIFTCMLISALLLGALSLISCKTPDDQQGSTPPEGNNAAVGSEGLTYELNSQSDGYIVTGMGTCTDTRVVIPSTYNGLPVMSIAKGAFQASKPPVSEKPSEDTGKDKYNDKYKDKRGSLAANINPLSAFALLFNAKLLSNETSESTNEAEKPEANITEVVIPDSVMDIGDEAFYGCGELASFEVSNLVNLIGTDAFKNTAYYLDESNWTEDSLYLDEYLVEVRNTVSGNYIVRDGTVNIASNAFEGCTGITSITFPSSLRFVGNFAFLGCTGITEVDLTIPGIQIGSNAFQNCTALTTVKIATNDVPNAPPVKSNIGIGIDRPDEVFMPGGSMDFAFDPTADPDLIYSASFGNYAFKGCTALTTVILGSNVGNIGSYAFEDCTALTSVDLSMITAADQSTVIVTPGYNYRFPTSLHGLFKNCRSLKEVKLPQGIQWLQYTFQGCTSLTEFEVPSTVKGLKNTFRNCSGLKSVTLPESVIALYGTFSGCTSLTEIELPETLVKIGAESFNGCESLTSIYIPDSVTEIGEYAFYLNGLLKISVGKGVKSVGMQALNHVYAILYRGTMEEWGQIALHNEWGGVDSNEAAIDIICTDGTIANCETFTESMEGILLADGTVYVHFLGVTVKLSPGGREEIISLSLKEVEAELQKTGAEGWRYVSAEEILTLEYNEAVMIYTIIKQMIFEYSESGKNQQGGNGSSGNNNSQQGDGTTTQNSMSGILLADGTLYVLENSVTVVVKDGKVEKSEVEYGTITAAIKKGEINGWKRLIEDKIREQYGEEIYKKIIEIAEKFSGEK